MHKRIFLVYVLIVFFIALLPACAGQDAGNGSPSGPSFRIITQTPRATATPTLTPTPQVPVLDPDELDGVSIDLWYFWDPTTPDTLAEAVDRFNADNQFGIQVNPRAFIHPVELEQAVTGAVSTGRPPDVVLAEPYQYLPWFDAGQLVELSPYLDNPVYGLALDEFYPAIANRDVYPAGRLGFPGLFSAHVLLYNRTWAESLGFDNPPQTPAAFVEQACAAHLANRDFTGGWMIDTTPAGAAAWLLAFDPAMQRRIDFKSEGIEAAYNFLVDLGRQGCAWQPAASYPDQAFVDRLGLIYAVGAREFGYVADAFAEANARDEWTAIGYPNPNGEPVISLYGQSYVILKSEVKSQISGWLLIRYLAGGEVQTQLAEEALYLPLDRGTAAALQSERTLPQAWRAMLDLLDQAVTEPPLRSWGVLRSVVQDAQAEALDERFVLGTLSLFLDRLETLAEDFQSQE